MHGKYHFDTLHDFTLTWDDMKALSAAITNLITTAPDELNRLVWLGKERRAAKRVDLERNAHAAFREGVIGGDGVVPYFSDSSDSDGFELEWIYDFKTGDLTVQDEAGTKINSAHFKFPAAD